MSTPEDILPKFGLNPKGVQDTLKNAALTEVLLQLDKSFGGTKLLYPVAAKLADEKQRDLVAQYVTDGKIKTTLQVDSAIAYLTKNGDVSAANADFDLASGVGITIGAEELEAEVAKLFAADAAAIAEDRYQFNFPAYLGVFKKDARLKWADPTLVKQAIDKKTLEVLGPKTEADNAAKGKKKEKKKVDDKPKEKKLHPADIAAAKEAKLRETIAAAVKAPKYQFGLGRQLIATLQENARLGTFPDENEQLEVCGWIRTCRDQKKMVFIELNDGSDSTNLQCVVLEGALKSEELWEECRKLSTGACLRISGCVIPSCGKGQIIEMKVSDYTLLGDVDESFPMAKTALGLPMLREYAHLRIRTNIVACAMRIRNAASFGIHKFFQERKFQYVHTPIITSNDCEGAGECFTVTNQVQHDGSVEMKEGKIDFMDDFFARKAMLTVSGQLNVETYAAALSNVYTFGPTFRAENSNTTRHLAEFWMIEPELYFCELKDVMNLAEDFLKYVITYVMEECTSDILYLEAFHEKRQEEEQKEDKARVAEGSLVDRLAYVVAEPFARVTYTEAIEILKKKEDSKEAVFEQKVEWGMDMGSEHERYLCETVFKKPTIVTNYPSDIKSFYMKQSEDGKTVEAMDILVPNIGEMIGGSAREADAEKLLAMMEKKGIPAEGLQWYLDLRRYGTAPHGGFGLGFERLLMLLTGMHNVRDVIPFPRYPGHAPY